MAALAVAAAARAGAIETWFPATVGESETSVKARLGEGQKSYPGTLGGQHVILFADKGCSVTVADDSATVTKVMLFGNRPGDNSPSYGGKVVNDLGMKDSLVKYQAWLGSGREDADLETVEGCKTYVWRMERYDFCLSVWDKDGSIRLAYICDPNYEESY